MQSAGGRNAPLGEGRLTAAEREVIITSADDEQVWHVFTESRRWGRRLTKIALALGIEPRLAGAGVEFDLPLHSVAFRKSKRKGRAGDTAVLAAARARAAAGRAGAMRT